MIDPNSQDVLIDVANEMCRLLKQYGLIETEAVQDKGKYYERMDDDHYAILEDFTVSIMDTLQNPKQNV